jgi:hypothetical protein
MGILSKLLSPSWLLSLGCKHLQIHLIQIHLTFQKKAIRMALPSDAFATLRA